MLELALHSNEERQKAKDVEMEPQLGNNGSDSPCLVETVACLSIYESRDKVDATFAPPHGKCEQRANPFTNLLTHPQWEETRSSDPVALFFFPERDLAATILIAATASAVFESTTAARGGGELGDDDDGGGGNANADHCGCWRSSGVRMQVLCITHPIFFLSFCLSFSFFLPGSENGLVPNVHCIQPPNIRHSNRKARPGFLVEKGIVITIVQRPARFFFFFWATPPPASKKKKKKKPSALSAWRLKITDAEQPVFKGIQHTYVLVNKC